MEFEFHDRAWYRALSNEEFELRRAEVKTELENKDSKADMEQMRSEVAMLREEDERRKAAASIVIEERKAVASGDGRVIDSTERQERKPEIKFVDKRDEALRSNEYKREFARYLTTRNYELPESFAQYQMRAEGDTAATTPSATDPAYGILADAGILVPLDIQERIISQVVDRGKIASEVNHTNERGGIDIPVGNFKMTASWIGEKTVSEPQTIDELDDKISFRYHILECRHSNTLLSEFIGPRVYFDKYAESAADAMTDALETAILRGTGTGCPLGLLVDTRITATQEIKAGDFTAKGIQDKIMNPIARLGSAYKGGKLYMAETTWNTYIEGMTDTNGQPVARVNYGIEGEPSYRLAGKTVEVLDEKYLPYFNDATAKSEKFMFWGNLKDYTLNSNLQLRADRWEDKDNNLYKSRLLMIADGRVVDPYGFCAFTAKASA